LLLNSFTSLSRALILDAAAVRSFSFSSITRDSAAAPSSGPKEARALADWGPALLLLLLFPPPTLPAVVAALAKLELVGVELGPPPPPARGGLAAPWPVVKEREETFNREAEPPSEEAKEASPIPLRSLRSAAAGREPSSPRRLNPS